MAELDEKAAATVFVVDDDVQVRRSLELIAQSVKLPVESFADAQSFLDSNPQNRAGCLVLDVTLPGMSGLELQERMRQLGIRLPIIMITAYAEVPMAVKAMENGAFGFLEKPFSRQQLLDKIQQAVARDSHDRERQVASQRFDDLFATLAPREREVMELLAAGRSTKEIASHLSISPKTVDFHRWNVLEKMQVESVVDLARMVAMRRMTTS